MKPVIAYFRVSTARQGQSGLGLEAQRDIVAAYASQRGRPVACEFVDVMSGKREDRPELQKALAKTRELKATLVVAKLDRLARAARFLDEIVSGDVDVALCNLPEPPPGPTGRFVVQIMASIAELEAGMVSERTTGALAAAKARGIVLGGWRGHQVSERARHAAAAAKKAQADAAALQKVPTLRELRSRGVEELREVARHLNMTSTQVKRLQARLSRLEAECVAEARRPFCS